MFNSRQEDLSKVFDRTWKANHNDVAKRGKVQINRIKHLTPGEQASNLQKKIDNAFYGKRQSNLNNIVKKWK